MERENSSSPRKKWFLTRVPFQTVLPDLLQAGTNDGGKISYGKEVFMRRFTDEQNDEVIFFSCANPEGAKTQYGKPGDLNSIEGA